MIAVMGPEAAVNAVFYNQIQAMPEAERRPTTEKLRPEYREDIDIQHLATELVIDAIVAPERLRDELVARFAAIAERPPRSRRRRSGAAWRRCESSAARELPVESGRPPC